MKSKIYKNKLNKGFTVVELMVVFLILLTLTSIVIVQWNRLSPTRTLNIASNEMVTQIRKIQGYASSSRNISSTTPIKFYVMKFDSGLSSYALDAVEADSAHTYHYGLESYNLPNGFYVSNIDLVDPNGNNSELQVLCGWLAFSAVEGQVYFFSGGKGVCRQGNTGEFPGYATIFNPPLLEERKMFDAQITIKHISKDISKVITIHGVSGTVESN